MPQVESPARTSIDGPFAESMELAADYWILPVKSMDEAVEPVERVPFEALAGSTPASTALWARSRSVSCSSWGILTH